MKMIEVNKENIVISGTPATLLTELGVIAHYLHHNVLVGRGLDPERSKAIIRNAVEIGFEMEGQLKPQKDQTPIDILVEKLDMISEILKRKGC